MSLRRNTALLLCCVGVGCAPGVRQPPAAAPSATGSSTTAPSATAESPTPNAAAGPAIVAPAPADCTAYVASTSTPAAENCPADEVGRLLALDDALAPDDAVLRNQKLLRLEVCPGFEPGLLLALRADLAPEPCADAIIEPWQKAHQDTLGIEVSQVLRGLSLAARLMRTSDEPPLLLPPFTREKFEAFLNASIRPWYLAQSKVVFDIASSGAKLSGYGKAVVAIEAGLSDLRFVENVRKVSLPAEMANDREVVEVYQQSLEDALEPRKMRGRDAILVGMLHFAQLGVLSDPRLQRARARLSRLFAGSRIDALDAILLPELPPVSAATPLERLAGKLPAFYADRLLGGDHLAQPSVVRALLERGLPPRLRQQLENVSHKSPEVARLFARGHLELGRRYFRPADFTRASILLEQKSLQTGPYAKESRFVAALAHALEGGPENAVQLMLAGPMLPKGMGHVESLDKLTNEPGNLGAMAAFDAGHLLSILPQEKPSPDHWLRIARYFDDAARKLADPKSKATAHARAEDARATAAQVREAVNAKPRPLSLLTD